MLRDQTECQDASDLGFTLRPLIVAVAAMEGKHAAAMGNCAEEGFEDPTSGIEAGVAAQVPKNRPVGNAKTSKKRRRALTAASARLREWMA